MYGGLDKSRRENDIGVVVDEKLSFGDHFAEKVNKANRIME